MSCSEWRGMTHSTENVMCFLSIAKATFKGIFRETFYTLIYCHFLNSNVSNLKIREANKIRIRHNMCTSLFRYTQSLRVDAQVSQMTICYTDLHKGGHSLDIACGTLVKNRAFFL